ncbi:11130_t:CDS:2 [Entrophospora sp. SA101]|nr:11130_t:CDS:2 [Entrophospora sp. SA101]
MNAEATLKLFRLLGKTIANENQHESVGNIKSLVNEFKGSSAVNKNKRYDANEKDSNEHVDKVTDDDEVDEDNSNK